MSQFEREIPGRILVDRMRVRLYTWNNVLVSRLILAGAFGVGAFLRVWQINAMGYNTDEAVYAGQAAAIAGVPVLKDLFPIFRAHPLLFQFVLSLLFRVGFDDLWGRLIAAGIGIGTVFIAYQLGKHLYGQMAGAFAAVFMALMPYHVVVSRQVLLDGPMTFFATLTLYMLARFASSGGKGRWLYATGASMGLTFLSKETGIVLLGAIYAFLALAREVKVKILDLLLATVVMVLVIAPFPISMSLAGGSGTGKQYLIWQLFRRANHEWTFYPTVVPPAIGLAVIALAAAGLWLLWRERSWRELLLLSWILVPVAFFQLWPTKGFQYLLPAAPAVAVLAARLVARWAPGTVTFMRRSLSTSWLPPVFAAITIFTLFFSSWRVVQPATSQSFLAGTGGVPGGREAGSWIQKNVPSGAVMLTVGPSMANIVQFYGHRKAYGLSVSPNPLFRNPSYTPITNPDLKLRRAELQYIVWDSFSSGRSPFFSAKLLQYVQKYNGRVAHIESVIVAGPDGKKVAKPVIIIYEVRP